MSQRAAKITLLATFTFFSFGLSYAQFLSSGNRIPPQIKVKVCDSLTQKPLDFATATLYTIDKSGKEEVFNYALSDTSGVIIFKDVRVDGKYNLKLEYAFYEPKIVPDVIFEMALWISGGRVKDLGVILLKENAVALEAARVIGRVAPVVYLGNDTIQYNAAAYDIAATDMLIDFFNKLPGWGINSEGKITVNGEVLERITVNNRVFFMDDPDFVSRILPASIVENVKVFNESSDFTKTTGIDDGKKRKTANVKVKDGMIKGMVGEMSAGAGAGTGSGTNEVYSLNAFLARFSLRNQYAFTGQAGNVSTVDAGMGAGMGAGAGEQRGPAGGITTTRRLGATANLISKNDKFKADVSYRYNSSNSLRENESHRENWLPNNTLIQDDSTRNRTINDRHSMNISMKHDFKNSSLNMRGGATYSYGTFQNVKHGVSTQQDGTLLNESKSENYGNSSSKSTDWELSYDKKFDKPLRALSLTGSFSFSESESDGYNSSTTHFFAMDREDNTDQKNTSLNSNFSLRSNISYYEPIIKTLLLNVAYSVSAASATNEKEYINKDVNGEYSVIDADFSDKYSNLSVTHTIGAYIDKQRAADTKITYRFGLDVMPQMRRSTGDHTEDLTQNVVNFAPRASFSYQHSQTRRFFFNYYGTTNSPTLSQLQPTPDPTDPLNFTLGNPDLIPEFRNRFDVNLHLNTIHRISFEGGFVLNQMINRIWFDDGGVRYTMPVNENGNFNIGFRYNLLKSLFKNKLTIYQGFNPSYLNTISYVNDQRNETKTVAIMEQMGIRFRADDMNMGANVEILYENASYSVTSRTNTASWTNAVNLSFGWTFLGELKFSTDASYRFYRGYKAGYNDPYWNWNANLSAPTLKKSLTISIIATDILNSNKNIRRTITDNYLLESKSNHIGQYFMLNLIYRFMTSGDTGAARNRANSALTRLKLSASFDQ